MKSVCVRRMGRVSWAGLLAALALALAWSGAAAQEGGPPAGPGGKAAPTISLGKAKGTAERVAETLAELEETEKELLKVQPEVLRWRDDLQAVTARLAELNRMKDEAAKRAAGPDAAKMDPSLRPHVDACVQLATELADALSFLVESFRQEQQELSEAMRKARRLQETLQNPPQVERPEGMALDEVLHYVGELSKARISLSLLKAQRAGLNEELDQRMRLKKLEFTMPELAEFGGDPEERNRTLALREEAGNLLVELKAYRKVLAKHLVGQTQLQLQAIRLEIFEREEEYTRLEGQRDEVFARLSVTDADVAAAGERLAGEQKRVEEEAKTIQRQLKALRVHPPEGKGGGTFTEQKEWELRITVLQHRLYLLDIELQVAKFRAAATETLNRLAKLQGPTPEFVKEFAWYLDGEKQKKAREELDSRREAWRHEYSQVSLEQAAAGDEELAGKVLDDYREILDLYDRIDARKWDMERAAELVRFHQERYELSQRDTLWYTWRIGASAIAFLVALFLSIVLGRVTLRPIVRREETPDWKRYLLFLGYVAGLLVVWLGLAALVVSFVWGQPAELDRLKDLVNATLFTIGEKEVTLAAIAGLLGIFALTVVVNRLVGRFIDRHIFAYFTWDVGVRHAFLAVLKYVILFVGFTLGLEFIGVGLSALALFAGVIGIGIGFGLQNIASNFIAGLIILFERPIKKGDYVDLGGLEGRVERISARATTLHTTDNVSVIVPNSEFIGGRVVNLSHGDTRVRIHVPVGVAYGSDVPKVHKALREAAAGCKEVLEAPAPSVRMNAFGDSAVSFSLLVWIDDFGRKGDIVSALNHAIELKFREQGIEIPFPQTDVHIRTPGK